MRKRLSYLLITSCLYSVNSSAETLLELYTQAENNAPQIKAAYADLQAVLEQKPQAQSQLLPQLSLGGSVTERRRNKGWIAGDKTLENTIAAYSLSLSVPVYRKDRLIQLSQADAQIRQTEFTYETSRLALMEQVTTRYFDVLAGNDNVEFARSAKAAYQRQLDQAKQRFDVGLIAITDVQEAQSGYDLAVADELQALNNLENAREALREVTGAYPNVLSVLNQDVALISPDPSNVDQWTETALKQNPQVLAAQASLEVAKQEIEKQRAANYPSVDLVAGHAYTNTLRGDVNPLSPSGTDNNIGLQLSVPLYTGGLIQSKIREAQQRYTQSLENLEKTRRTVQLQAHNAYANVLSNISRVKALKQALTSTKTALEATQTGFEVGTRTSVDVLNVQRDVLKAESNYSRARYDYVLNTLRLKQAAGLLASSDLQAINSLLRESDPEAEKKIEAPKPAPKKRKVEKTKVSPDPQALTPVTGDHKLNPVNNTPALQTTPAMPIIDKTGKRPKPAPVVTPADPAPVVAPVPAVKP
jgi:outer membrane protein